MRCNAWTSRCVVALILFLTLGFGATADDKAQGAWLGVRLNGMASDGGIRVAGIFEGSPADRAGLRARDTILTWGGEPVTGVRELIGTIRQQESGTWLPLTVLRQGKEVELSVRLGDRPAQISQDGLRRGWIGLEAHGKLMIIRREAPTIGKTVIENCDAIAIFIYQTGNFRALQDIDLAFFISKYQTKCFLQTFGK